MVKHCNGKYVLTAQLYVLLHLYLVLCKKYPMLGLLHTPPPLHRPPTQCRPVFQKNVCKRRLLNDNEDLHNLQEKPNTPATLCVTQTVQPLTVQTTTSTITVTAVTTDGTTVTVLVHL
ncbi:E4 [Common chimpanzee papillomavirus 1]|uniref:E4 n=1 Tax=Pygmy chimpanzee papillomavirus type 1C TaxID=521527 RepID=O37388_PCPVC|nr:E4 [Common chimpanzee papillomavirus 1]